MDRNIKSIYCFITFAPLSVLIDGQLATFVGADQRRDDFISLPGPGGRIHH